MRDYGAVELVIRTKRKVIAVRLLALAVLFAALAWFVWVMLPASYGPWAVAAVVVTWFYLTRSLLYIFVTGRVFTLTDRGLLAHAGSVDFVAWEEIASAGIAPHGAIDGIDLDVTDLESVLARLSPVRRALLRGHIKEGGKPGLAASFGEGGSARLLELIQDRIALPATGGAESTRLLSARSSFEEADPDSETGDSPAKPYARLWTIATIVYMAGVALVAYLVSQGYWVWVMPDVRYLLLPAPIFLSFGLRALYTGEVSIKNFTFYRSKNPFGYWAQVVLLLSLGLVLLLVGIGVI